MKSTLLVLIALCTLITGCATTQQLNPADRASFKSIRVNASVEKPAQMYYLGPGGGVGLMFGAIGGAVTAAQSPGEQFRLFAEQNNIAIERIVLEETTNALRQSGKVSLTESPSANTATLNILITQYGFSIPNGFSSKLVPIIGIKCSLVDPAGKTIWSSSDRAHPLGNPVEGRSLEDFKSNPELIREAWRLSSKAVVTSIVSNL